MARVAFSQSASAFVSNGFCSSLLAACCSKTMARQYELSNGASDPLRCFLSQAATRSLNTLRSAADNDGGGSSLGGCPSTSGTSVDEKDLRGISLPPRWVQKVGPFALNKLCHVAKLRCAAVYACEGEQHFDAPARSFPRERLRACAPSRATPHEMRLDALR